ncbi:MAG: secretion protein F [Lachnospiraceae bacterium]|nr:secretion protein F [Lachnospiraceae bacterium]MCI9660362.1 secretion protein F [Lachnospiraceae bacterium]
MGIGRLVILAVATVLVLMWIVLAKKYEKTYAGLTESIDSEKYRYPELFCIGFAIMHLLGLNSSSKRARKRIKEISEIEGKKYAEYYFYVINGAKWTYGFTLLVFAALLGALGNAPIALVFGALLAGLLMWYLEEIMNDQLKERRDELLTDMPQMLSKLTLLVNSGMVIRDAWKKVACGNEQKLYQEMQLTVQEMQNGVSELDAYRNFSERCAIKEIRRFSSTMIQNMQKGNAEIAYFLKEMSDDMWEEKKHLVKRKGEAAASKLLMPTALIFIGILIMIMVPAFMSM